MQPMPNESPSPANRISDILYCFSSSALSLLRVNWHIINRVQIVQIIFNASI